MSRKVDNAPAIWDLAALGNRVGNILRDCLEVCECLSIERGSLASWLVEGQFAHRWRFVISRLDMYRTNVLMCHTMVLLARPTKGQMLDM
jgi:hypothetical protein